MKYEFVKSYVISSFKEGVDSDTILDDAGQIKKGLKPQFSKKEYDSLEELAKSEIEYLIDFVVFSEISQLPNFGKMDKKEWKQNADIIYNKYWDKLLKFPVAERYVDKEKVQKTQTVFLNKNEEN